MPTALRVVGGARLLLPAAECADYAREWQEAMRMKRDGDAGGARRRGNAEAQGRARQRRKRQAADRGAAVGRLRRLAAHGTPSGGA